MTDPFVESTVELLRSRARVGMAKYGTDLTRTDLTPAQWLRHLQEELLDAANYIARLLALPLPNTAQSCEKAGGGEEDPRDPAVCRRCRGRNPNCKFCDGTGFATPRPADTAESDARDAKRYRWLRDKSQPGLCAFYLSVGMALHNIRFEPQSVDMSIDQAIAAAEGDL